MTKKFVAIPNVEELIQDAIQREDWFSGFSNAVTFFEYWGYYRLYWYCINKKLGLEKEIKSFRVNSIITMLYLTKQIDQDTFGKIRRVIHERNKLVHPISTEAGITYRDRKEKDTAIEILESAVACIKELRKGVGKPITKT
jgi:hypothetical protein